MSCNHLSIEEAALGDKCGECDEAMTDDKPTGTLTDEQIDREFALALDDDLPCCDNECPEECCIHVQRFAARRIEAIVRKDERKRCAAIFQKPNAAPEIFVTSDTSFCKAAADAILRGDEDDEEDDCPIHGKLGSSECPRC